VPTSEGAPHRWGSHEGSCDRDGIAQVAEDRAVGIDRVREGNLGRARPWSVECVRQPNIFVAATNLRPVNDEGLPPRTDAGVGPVRSDVSTL
jgi:hypothetical protein